ncbi:MAG: AAA family ATPase [Acholeplasmatales bacterium]|nr:AAA family ATPase [Acholeplasmataceae bacterium]MDY0115479.1 AAA family ATPase [Acholeplasmatales bacterium]MCK9234607.1 AAA family ATPase [Acholeplasmataceae bacterium]MCK9288878.1 AAA family ATPase [Acholeplasmataceae bacterium]MCK9428158.1 AAA family ATPase [Acholeplasmataceae bacterium]
MLKRKIYNRLLRWKKESNGRTALLIEGARRVGKTYIIKKFGENEYESYILIDFSYMSKNLKDIFDYDKTNLDLFFMKLSILYETKLVERNSLIIFDEVQLFPEARQLIKQLVKDGRYDYIETGSLLSIKQNVKDILIPSEEEKIEMFPLDFEEFLWAVGDNVSYKTLEIFKKKLKPLGQDIHHKIMTKFRLYMIVGGMPQAVMAYLENKDFDDVERVKTNILNLYRNDIVKFANRNSNYVTAIFDKIPAELTKKEKKFMLSTLSKNARSRTYNDAFMWLIEAKIVNPCFNTTDPNIGLAMSGDYSSFKLYMGDTGLLVTQAINDNNKQKNFLFNNLLLNDLNINQGMFAENIVAQSLVSNGHKLFFYSKNDRNNSENTMEIDFVITDSNKLIPIEVKSGSYRSVRSLDKFTLKFKKRITKKIVLHSKDLKLVNNIIYLPIYMASLL